MRSERLIGLPVIHINLGKRCGTVQNLILDPTGRRVAGLLVALGGWRKRGLLPTEKVYALGDDAVTIEDEEAILPAETESKLRTLWLKRLDLNGMQVLSVTGTNLGSVAAFEFAADGSIETLHLARAKRPKQSKARKMIPGSMVRSFGEDAVIVASEAEDWLSTEPAPQAQAAVLMASELDDRTTQEGQETERVGSRLIERITGWGLRSKTEETPSITEPAPPTQSEPKK